MWRRLCYNISFGTITACGGESYTVTTTCNQKSFELDIVYFHFSWDVLKRNGDLAERLGCQHEALLVDRELVELLLLLLHELLLLLQLLHVVEEHLCLLHLQRLRHGLLEVRHKALLIVLEKEVRRFSKFRKKDNEGGSGVACSDFPCAKALFQQKLCLNCYLCLEKPDRDEKG